MALVKRFITAYRFILTGMLFVFVLTPAVVSAQSQSKSLEEITVSPTSKDHKIKAGESARGSFNVVNTGQVKFDFTVYARPYSINENSQPNFEDTKGRSDAYSWIQFEKTSWQIDPGETAKISYEIIVPKNASPGGHYGIMFAETQPDTSVNGRAIVGKKRVGSILRVTVDGDIKQQGRPLGISLPWLQFQPPLTATTRIENSGNVNDEATIKMVARDVFGNVKHTQAKTVTIYPSFDETENVAVAQSTDINWSGAAWFSLYNVEVSASFQGETISESKFVLILPRWLIVIAVVIVVGGGYVLFRRRK